MDVEDEDVEELADAEGPDAADIDEDDSESCPYCGKLIYDDAEQCPHCGNYLSSQDAPNRKPLWIVIGVVITLAVIAWWTF